MHLDVIFSIWLMLHSVKKTQAKYQAVHVRFTLLVCRSGWVVVDPVAHCTDGCGACWRRYWRWYSNWCSHTQWGVETVLEVGVIAAVSETTLVVSFAEPDFGGCCSFVRFDFFEPCSLQLLSSKERLEYAMTGCYFVVVINFQNIINAFWNYCSYNVNVDNSVHRLFCPKGFFAFFDETMGQKLFWCLNKCLLFNFEYFWQKKLFFGPKVL